MKEIKYYLTKVNNQWFLVSDERPITGEYLDDAFQIRTSVIKDRDYWESRPNYYKIISQQPILTSLSEEEQKIIGFVDVEKLALKTMGCSSTKYLTASGKIAYNRFIEGFNLCQQMNEKKYSEKDLILAFEVGRNYQLTGENNFNEFVGNLEKPKLIEVEVEMEECGVVYSGGLQINGKLGGKGIQPHYSYRPKITNEGIKILKLK